jgi:hypothetical protein
VVISGKFLIYFSVIGSFKKKEFGTKYSLIFFFFTKMLKVCHKINHWSSPLLNDYAPNGMKSKHQQLYNWDTFHEVHRKWTHLYSSEYYQVKIPQILGPKEFCFLLKPLSNKQSQQNSNVQQVKNHVSGLVPLPLEYHSKFNISMLNNGVP